MAEKAETKRKIKINSSKRITILLVSIPIFLGILIYYIYFIYNNFLLNANNYFGVFLYYLLIIGSFILMVISVIVPLQFTSIELYENGIKPLNSKLLIVLKLQEGFIHFKDVLEFVKLGQGISGIKFQIILKNNKDIYQSVDTSKDFKKIIKMFKKFKNQESE